MDLCFGEITIFGIKLELIWVGFVINFFLSCISSIGFFIIQKSLKAWDDDNAVSLFFGCIFIMASFVFQWFVLMDWFKSFY
jgi:hypothetical protein